MISNSAAGNNSQHYLVFLAFSNFYIENVNPIVHQLPIYDTLHPSVLLFVLVLIGEKPDLVFNFRVGHECSFLLKY